MCQNMFVCHTVHLLEESAQDKVSISTSEIKFVAASQAVQEAIYLHETLGEFGYSQTKPTLSYEHNPACMAMSKNTVRRKFFWHINIR